MIKPVTVFAVTCDGCQWFHDFSAPRAQDYWSVEELHDFEEALEDSEWARSEDGSKHWCSSCVAAGLNKEEEPHA